MDGQQIRVLVVDDSSFMRGALVRMIERDPRFKVIDTASNGKEGVEKAVALKPDVMTLDVEMPVMTGLEALKEIMGTVKTPVIMLSTLTEAGADTTIKALELGAVDFLPKALNDKDNNIFRGADGLYEKLLAAASISGRRVAVSSSPASVSEPRFPAFVSTNTPLAVPLPVAPVMGRVDAKVLLIGSSTGGPKALQSLISKLPARLPVPAVVAQHMPPQFTLALAKRLDETCAVNVVEARAGETLLPGKVYVAPGGMHLRVGVGGVVIVDEDKGESPYKPSVDVLAESLRNTYGKQVLAVMLTGMGNDGTREYVKLKGLGAYVIAQDEASSVVYGMPRAVLEAGGVSEVLDIEQIGPRVCSLLGA